MFEGNENNGKFGYSSNDKTTEDKGFKFDIALSLNVQNNTPQFQIYGQRRFSRKRNDSGYEDDDALPANGMVFEEITENEKEENAKLNENSLCNAVGNMDETERMLETENHQKQNDKGKTDVEKSWNDNKFCSIKKSLIGFSIILVFSGLILLTLWFTQWKTASKSEEDFVNQTYFLISPTPITPCSKECTNSSIANGWLECVNDTIWIECYRGFKSSKDSFLCQNIEVELKDLKCQPIIAAPKRKRGNQQKIEASSDVLLLAGGKDQSGNIVSDISIYPLSSSLSQCLPHLPVSLRWGGPWSPRLFPAPLWRRGT